MNNSSQQHSKSIIFKKEMPTTEDRTRTVDEGNNNNNNENNGGRSTRSSRKVNKRRKSGNARNMVAPMKSTVAAVKTPTIEEPKIDTTSSEQQPSPRSSSQKSDSSNTNRSTSSISSTRNDKEKMGNGEAQGGVVAPPPRGTVKRFFLKFTEKIGGIEKTEYSQQFLESFKDIDNYKLALEDVVENLIGIAQRNSKLFQRPLERMQFEYYDNENPYEQLTPALRSTVALFNNNPIEKHIKCVEKLGTLHRDFHRRARRSLRDIRQFLCVDFDELCQARNGMFVFFIKGFGDGNVNGSIGDSCCDLTNTSHFLVLNQRRQDMDYAKHELKNAKAPEVIEMKNSVYENATQTFEAELQKVLKFLDKFPRQKESHLKNIQNFFTIYKLYHEQMSIHLKL